MRRFLLFAFDHYYPSGGLRDVVNSYDTLEEAIDDVSRFGKPDEMYILDRELWKVVHGVPPTAYDPKTGEHKPIKL